MKTAVVVDKDYGSITLEELESLKKELEKDGIMLRLCHFQTEEEIINNCQEVEAILGTGNPPITAQVLTHLPQLKVVQRFGIGVNSIDLETASACKTAVLYMPGFSVDELAVHAAALILALIRNTAYYDRHIRAGEWPKASYYTPKAPGDLTLGLFGFGGSAKPLYKIFHNGFGTKVIACDPYISEEVRREYETVEFVDFDTLLRRSDIVSIHAPLNKETEHIFDKSAFQRMKQDSMIINIARGPLIKENDLIWALKHGEIRYAGLDVFEKEPLSEDSPLKNMDNVLLTCHSAFYGVNSKKRQLTWARELLVGALNEGVIPKVFLANQSLLKQEGEYQFI